MQEDGNTEENDGSISDSRIGEVPSSAQKRLWFLDKLIGPSPLYNIRWLYRLIGPLNLDALRKSLNEIIRRHDVLRASFNEHQGEPIVRTRPLLTLEVPVVIREGISDSQREAVAKKIEREEGAQSFDLERDPLIRATLVTFGPETHFLILTIHHIVFDGWSIEVFDRELSILYSAYNNGTVPTLPELSMGYSEYSAQQNKWIEEETSAEEMNFWKKQLANLPVMDLPTDYPRPKEPSHRGSSVEMQLSLDLTEQLEALGKENKVSFYIILLSAFKVLLYRYTNQHELVVGTPVAGRPRSELDPLIGFFVNTLVLRTDLSGNPKFNELLARVAEVFWDSFDNQELPFDKIVEVLQPEREMGQNPLIQIMFLLEIEKDEGMQLDDLEIEQLPVEENVSKMDLTLATAKREGILTIRANYTSDLFSNSTIKRLLTHFEKLLEEIVNNPQTTISQLAILPESERQLILVSWNNTTKDYPAHLCLHKLFENQAKSTPDNVALVFEGQQLSYSQLDEEANRMANHLLSLGVGPNDLVGVWLERSMEMVVVLLGILKTGAAYLPLDPAYPADRLKFMIKDAQPKAIIGKEKRADEATAFDAEMVYVEDEEIRKASSMCPTIEVDSENLAYVIYTSGSTGRPKGVMIPHRAAVNHISWRKSFFGLNENDRVLQTISLSFDVSVWEVFGPLCSGASVVLARPNYLQDSTYLTDLIPKEGITMMSLIPSNFRRLLDDPGISNCQSLRMVNCGGEAMTPDLAEKVFDRLQIQLFNGYGPTETTVGVTYWECKQGENRSVVPIGKPIANTEIYILDGNLQPVPIGVMGELYIGGDSLAKGYLNRPELTAERFIPHPFGKQRQKIYRTGDLGRYLRDGNIEFLGRVDQQVKLRGLRIELGEIENLLLQEDGVREAVAIVREDKPGDQRLVAYVVGEYESTQDAHKLSSNLEKRLPKAMIPGAIVKLDEMPLTPNGKLDRDALPIPSWGEGNDETFTAPRDPFEQKLASIWSKILEIEKVGIHGNFFRLGGHSLHAIRLKSRIKDVFEVEISLQVIFQNPTIAQLGKSIAKAQINLRN